MLLVPNALKVIVSGDAVFHYASNYHILQHVFVSKVKRAVDKSRDAAGLVRYVDEIVMR